MVSPAERVVERALARAVLRPRPYSDQEIEAAEARVATRLANRMVYRALCLDDEIRDGIGDGMRPAARMAGCTRGPSVEGPPERLNEARRLLAVLCRTVMEREGALQHMAAFLGRHIPQPDGARVLGCVLQLAGREDSAQFWWQFAAGAGDAVAAYCLYLHHLALGEVWEAELWRRQVDPGPSPDTTSAGAAHDPRAEHASHAERPAERTGGERHPEAVRNMAGVHPVEDMEDGSSPGLVLRVLTRLRGNAYDYLTERASAVLHYVPGAVHFVDEIELPLPAADFVERIEELTATA